MATRDARGDRTGAVTTGGGTEPMAQSAAVHRNASSHTRPDVPPMLGRLATMVRNRDAAGTLLVAELQPIVTPPTRALVGWRAGRREDWRS